MRTRSFWLVAVGGTLGIPIAASLADVRLEPPSGAWHILFWPVDFLLWASGPGAALSSGQFEWTPVQDVAVLLGIGCTWLFWVLALGFTTRFLAPMGRSGGSMRLLLAIMAAGIPLLACVERASAQAQAGAVVLQIEPDARTNGMGKAGTAAATGAGALWWNPATIALSEEKDIQYTHTQLVPGLADDIFFGSLAAIFPVRGFGSLGVSFSYLTYDPQYEVAPAFYVAANVTPSLAIGGAFKIIYVDYDLGGSGTTVAFDAGLTWAPSPVIIGFSAQALGPDITIGPTEESPGESSSRLPRALRFGIAYQVLHEAEHKILAGADLNKPMVAADDGPMLNAGVEYGFREIAFGRFGWVYEGWYSDIDPINGPSAGLGIQWRGVYFDYATIPQAPDLDRVNRFTLGVAF